MNTLTSGTTVRDEILTLMAVKPSIDAQEGSLSLLEVPVTERTSRLILHIAFLSLALLVAVATVF